MCADVHTPLESAAQKDRGGRRRSGPGQGIREQLELRSDNNRLGLGARFQMKFRDVTYVLGASVSSCVKWGGHSQLSVASVWRQDACLVCDAWRGHGAGEPVPGSPGFAVVNPLIE